MILSTKSPYTYVWHENSGQTMPDGSKDISSHLDTNGMTINIADNVSCEEPLILINSATCNNSSKNVINIGKNSRVQIIEYLMSDDKGASNIVETVINCAQGTSVRHCIIQQANLDDSITQEAITTINQLENSSVFTNVFAFGGGKSNTRLNVALNGENANISASSLAYTKGSERQEVFFNIEHMKPHCTSTSLARSVLKDKSYTDFVGKITVHKGAVKTSADLQIKNLLCSAKAQADNKPELEIYNDDVKCSHGSSTGQLDEDALFYMRSRGIDIKDATEMLIAGFIKPVIDSCEIPSVCEYVESMIAKG